MHLQKSYKCFNKAYVVEIMCRAAQLRVGADGGANRVYDDIP